jgi:hypothetical protein
MNPDHPVFRENLARLLTILTQIKPALPDGQWFLNGSAVLYLHDIWTGRPMGDLDVFLATRPWFEFPTVLNPAHSEFYGGGWQLRTPAVLGEGTQRPRGQRVLGVARPPHRRH